MHALLNSIGDSIRGSHAKIRDRHAKIGVRRRRIVLLSTAVPLVAVAALSLTLTGEGDRPSAVEAAEPVKLAAAAPEAAIEVKRETKSARPAEPAEEPEAEEEVAGDAELRLSPLDRSDPRWAAAPATAVPDASRSPVAEALRQHAENVDAAEGEEPTLPLDRSTTAAIGAERPLETGADAEPFESSTNIAAAERADTGTTVAIAETPAEVAALEVAAAKAASAHSDPAFSAASTRMLDAHAKEYVNFRDAPSNDSNVIRVVAVDEAFQAQPVEECVHFCAVVIDGQSGYIHKDFITYEGQTAEAAPASEPAEAAAATASAVPAAPEATGAR